MQLTLDGMAAAADGSPSFLGENPTFDWELYDNVDACVLGRVMYPEYEEHWRAVASGSRDGGEQEVRYARFADRTPHHVLTRTVDEFDWPVAVPASLDTVRELRESDGGTIYVVGGTTVLGAVIDAGLLDEVRVTVHPVLLGGGLPLFGRVTGEQWYSSVDVTPLPNARVRLVYRR